MALGDIIALMKLLIDQNRISSICHQEGIVFLGLFGSQSRGDAHASSDIDLLVDFNQTKSFFQLAQIQQKLEEVFDKKVDLVLNTAVKELVRPYILKDLITLYGKRQQNLP